jgi:hypothetical protein
MLALCGSAFAGDIPCPPIAPPSQHMTTQEPIATGGIIQNEVADSLPEIVLTALALLPSLL